MRIEFEAKFKTAKDEQIFLTQITSIKKLRNVSMRDFVASFNKITKRILVAARPTASNLKTFFISAMPPDINYDLR